jgi:hypothetical protein
MGAFFSVLSKLETWLETVEFVAFLHGTSNNTTMATSEFVFVQELRLNRLRW